MHHRILAVTAILVATPASVTGQGVPPDMEKPEDAAEVFPVWPGSPPGTEVTGTAEQIMPAPMGQPGRWVRNVEVPTLTAFLPDSSDATGTAVVVAPGGGNLFLSIDSEGYDLARWLARRGVVAFVLRYRVRPTPREDGAFMEAVRRMFTGLEGGEDAGGARAPWPHGADDGRQAIRVVRERAGRWGIDPDRIGIVGFSAGGLVVNDVAVDHDVESRPDFAASIYAGASGPIAVPDDAPPLFIAWAVDDSLMRGRMLPLFTAWRDAGRPVELHAYESGGHGFGMRVQDLTSDRWIDALGAWMAQHGLMSTER